MFRFVSMLAVMVCLGIGQIWAQSTEFVYQGSLKDGANPANGNYDFEFRIFDAASGGNQLGVAIQRFSLIVTNGIFSVPLDFGDLFPGADRYLEIRTRQSSVGNLVVLTPRQRFTSAPYSVKSVTAGNALQLGGINANQYVQANSGTFIENRQTQQPSSNFNISGSGIAGVLAAGEVNASAAYNLGGQRVLSVSGDSMALGHNTGTIGASIGTTIVGINAGSNANAANNSFFGAGAGQNSTSGFANSFFGRSSGSGNTTGSANTFVGSESGTTNGDKTDNSYFGRRAGFANAGNENSFFGSSAGGNFGLNGNKLTLLGFNANASQLLVNSTAVGHRAFVTNSNSVVLGSIDGVNGATADTNVGIGTTAPARRLHVANGPSGATSLGSSDLVIEDDAAAFQHFLTPDDIESGLLFGDPTDSIGGGIVFNNASTNSGIMFRSGGNVTRMILNGSGQLGIGISPADSLHVNGNIRVATLGSAGSTQLCRNGSNQISTCTVDRGQDRTGALEASIADLRNEITALKEANARQQRQIDEQLKQIEVLIRVGQTSDLP